MRKLDSIGEDAFSVQLIIASHRIASPHTVVVRYGVTYSKMRCERKGLRKFALDSGGFL